VNASWSVLLDIALRTTIVYAALLAGIRLTGQRQLGQMSPFDLVLLLIIANAVQNAMVGPDTSLVGGLVAAAVLLFWHQVINRLRTSSRRVSRLLGGEGVLLINDGHVLPDHLRRAGVTADELQQALREHGVPAVDQVRLAVLEPDGAISVIRFEDLKPGLQTQPHHRIKGLRKGVNR
jgi:uncharacterized membrane protein YcaP (DUF421 family)